MKPYLCSNTSERGGLLVSTLLVVFILFTLVASILHFSTQSYRSSHRQSRVDLAKLVAESEMEYLYYRWQIESNSGTGALLMTARLQAQDVIGTDETEVLTPFTAAVADQGWSVTRQIDYLPVSPIGDGSAIGFLPGDTRTARNYYFNAKTSATRSDGAFGSLESRAGRRFVRSERSLFQDAVFYQGDLEIATGGDMTIAGPITCNSNVYMGSQTGATLTITAPIYVAGMFNGSTNVLNGTQLRLTSGTPLNDPVFDPNPADGEEPDQTLQRGIQVTRLQGAQSFIGNVSATQAANDYPEAYKNASGVKDPNEVLRSIIAPPPLNETGEAIAEHPTIQARRMYNRAGIIITINEDGSLDLGTPTNKSLYTSAYNSYVSVDPDRNVMTSIRSSMYDKRESTNISLSTLDVGRLNAAFATNTTLRDAFNGVVYIQDKSTSGGLKGVRLKNAETLPNYTDGTGQQLGFAVVTEHGLYVQGNYNTSASGSVRPPSVLMGDAVTVLSGNWDDSRSAGNVFDRPATSVTINSAILTGNTPSDPTTNENSGGVQNLIRLLENWSGQSLTIEGSLGQLFTSRYMTGRFRGNNYNISSSGDADYVYQLPEPRTLIFDQVLANQPPSWSPSTTTYSRGEFFIW